MSEDVLKTAVRRYQEELEKRKDQFERLRKSEDYEAQASRLYKLSNDFLSALRTSWIAATRIPAFNERSFLMRAIEDVMEAAVLLTAAVDNGGRNSARRELRYLLEVSVKSLYVDQSMPTSTFEERLIFFDRRVGKSGVVPEVNNLRLYLAPPLADSVISDIKAAYGRASNYVHLTSTQIEERIRLVGENVTLGFDTVETLRKVNDEIFEVFALVLVLYFHGIGQSTCGDLFEGVFNYMPQWSFHWHPHVVSIDEIYDYKAERQDRLEELRALRAERLSPVPDRSNNKGEVE